MCFGSKLDSNLAEDRPFFTKEQCELINGHPFKIENQDTIEDLLEITNDEQTFWKMIALLMTGLVSTQKYYLFT